MIQSVDCRKYKGIEAWQMHDAGAYWWEVYDGANVMHFNTWKDVENYVDKKETYIYTESDQKWNELLFEMLLKEE